MKRKPLTRQQQTAKRRQSSLKPVIPEPSLSTPKIDANKPRISVVIPPVLAVKEFAETLNLPVTQVIATLMKNGVIATINENIDAETAMIVGDELGFDVKEESAPADKIAPVVIKEDKGARIPRPPVVTIMGHVDHGKTTLLDSIRRTNVVSTESGGITQHIGAYQVSIPTKEKKNRLITFLDTPGHEAFSAMRAHGASITDIVVLVVAADDGVKPQTVEAINHANAAGVPIIVAINKIDMPGANPERVKQELAERDLVPEDWGGQTTMIPISAKKAEHLDDLLEMILLVADLHSYTTNPHKPATGVVIESHMQPGAGPRATILINDGTLNQGDVVVIDGTYGKIRFMEDFRGRRLKSATASTPVSIAGLQEVPKSGEPVITVDSEKTARDMTQVKSAVRQNLGLNEVSKAISEGKMTELKIILKTDVQGSLEAIKNSLSHIGSAEAGVQIINEGVGNITESDVNMASATDAIIVAFRTSVTPPVRNLAERLGIKITIYEIIYQLLDDIYSALSGLLEPEKVEIELGKAEILQIFHSTKNDQIVGVRVTDGKLAAGSLARVLRDKETIGEASIKSLHRGQEEVDTIVSGTECGVSLNVDFKLQPKDRLQAYQIEQRVRKLS